ncbi:hypothetical protein KA107_00595 [Candidatus Pacearchaeota archaeon]|nr:hypothetical protein [Candidatus Pacearchaeota archaeon]
MVLFFNFKNTNFQNVKTKGPFYATAFFLLHLVSVNLALAVTIHTRATPISWLYSLGVMIFVFVVTYLFTDHKLNINFIREFEFVKLKPSIYWIAWFIVAFIVLVIPTYFLQNWIGSLFA